MINYQTIGILESRKNIVTGVLKIILPGYKCRLIKNFTPGPQK